MKKIAANRNYKKARDRYDEAGRRLVQTQRGLMTQEQVEIDGLLYRVDQLEDRVAFVKIDLEKRISALEARLTDSQGSN